MSKTAPYFYLISNEGYLICNFEACAESERTFDINVEVLVFHKELLKLLLLFDIDLPDKRKAEWFCHYLSAFNRQAPKLGTSSVVRVLVTDSELLEKLKPYKKKSKQKALTSM